MKITNDGQFSNLYKRQISFPYTTDNSQGNRKQKPDYTVISRPLTSSSWVTVRKRSKGTRALDSSSADYRLKKVGNFWIDIDKPKMSDIEKAQWELYRKLKKEHDIRQKTKQQTNNLLQSNKIQTTHQIVDGVTVNIKKIPNFDGSLFRKAI